MFVHHNRLNRVKIGNNNRQRWLNRSVLDESDGLVVFEKAVIKGCARSLNRSLLIEVVFVVVSVPKGCGPQCSKTKQVRVQFGMST